MKRTVLVLAAALLIPATWYAAPAAAGGTATPQLAAAAATEAVFGAELMTQAQRDAYLKKIAAAKTETEKTKIRQQHHDEMVALAKKKGVTIADPATARATDTMGY